MANIPASKLSRFFANERRTGIDQTVLYAQSTTSLSRWMMILGTIGFVLALADFTSSWLGGAMQSGTSSLRQAWLLHEQNPLKLVLAAWPLMLALTLARTGWRQLLVAAALTFLFLAAGEIIELSSTWNRPRETWLMVGSFRINRLELLRSSPSAVMLGSLGIFQILMQLGTGIYAVRLLRTQGSDPIALPAPKPAGGRRAQFGRIAIYLSLAYLVLMVRIPVWSAYLEVLNHSQFLREYILQNDLDRIRNDQPRVSRVIVQPRGFELNILLDSGARASREGRYKAAKEYYSKFLTVSDGYGPHLPPSLTETVCVGLNNVAWLLATCPKIELRDPAQAVAFATRVTTMQKDDSNAWNTLGVARFRNGDLQGSREALDRSMELRKGGDSYDWFFLAMLSERAGKPDSARQWYDRATRWFLENRPMDLELHMIQVEAATELKLPRPNARFSRGEMSHPGVASGRPVLRDHAVRPYDKSSPPD